VTDETSISSTKIIFERCRFDCDLGKRRFCNARYTEVNVRCKLLRI